MQEQLRYVGARMGERDRALIEKVCKSRGEDIASFLRRAVKMELARLSFLPAEEKKALGLPPKREDWSDASDSR